MFWAVLQRSSDCCRPASGPRCDAVPCSLHWFRRRTPAASQAVSIEASQEVELFASIFTTTRAASPYSTLSLARTNLMSAELQMIVASDGSCTVCSHYNHGNAVARRVSTPFKLIILRDLSHKHTYEQGGRAQEFNTCTASPGSFCSVIHSSCTFVHR